MAKEVRQYDPGWEAEISDKLKERFGDRIEILGSETRRIQAKAGRCDIHDILKYIRDGLDFEHCANTFGVDYVDHLAVVYHIESYTEYRGTVIEIEVDVP